MKGFAASAPFKRFVRRRRMKRLFENARAGRWALRQCNPFEHFKLVHSLEQRVLDLPPDAFGKMLPPGFEAASESVVRQALLAPAYGAWLLAALLRHRHRPDAALTVPLPEVMRARLRSDGLRIRSFASRALWALHVIGAVGLGLRKFVGLLSYSLRAGQSFHVETPYSIVVVTSPSALPCDAASWPSGYDYVSWTWRHLAVPAGIRHLRLVYPGGDAPALPPQLSAGKRPLPPLPKKADVAFLSDALKIVASCLAGLAFGQWWRGIALADCVELAYVRRLPAERLARQYLFDTSVMSKRDLWTYDVEARGADVALVLYSSNYRHFLPHRRTSADFGAAWRGLGWTRYFIWNDADRDFLREVGQPTDKVVMVEPVDYADSKEELPAMDEPCIAVFDVMPHKQSWLSGRGIPQIYYNGDVVSRFLEDVREVCRAAGMRIAVKGKRGFVPSTAPNYRRAIEAMRNQPDIIFVPSGIAARRVIERSSAVISLPFTSTASLGQKCGLPSVYYDPTGTLTDHEPYAHGIEILCGRAALADWISGLRASSQIGERERA